MAEILGIVMNLAILQREGNMSFKNKQRLAKDGGKGFGNDVEDPFNLSWEDAIDTGEPKSLVSAKVWIISCSLMGLMLEWSKAD